MAALFHAKSRTCINRFVKASQLNAGPDNAILCDRSRFAAGRKAADEYLQKCDRRHHTDAGERQKKVENLLTRVDSRDRSVLAVAEVSLAHAMPTALLERAARGHVQAAQNCVALRMWKSAEQELRVVETMYQQAAETARRPTAEISKSVQDVWDLAAQTRCRDILTSAQQHCERQLFGAAQIASIDLASAVRSLSATVSVEGRARLQKLVEEANDLRLTAELGADQAAIESALYILRQGDAASARNQLQVLAAQVAARPRGHPSHEDLGAIAASIRACEDSLSLDADCLALSHAQSAGDLRQTFVIATRIKGKLWHLPQDVSCRTSAGIIAGLRAWDPHQSNLLGFAHLLEQSRHYVVANRRVVEDTIRALGALEGPAAPFTVDVGDISLKVPMSVESFAYPSLKARIAAQSPAPGGSDAIITLRMGAQSMYFHSGNYASGLADIIETAPHLFGEYAARARTQQQFEILFDALGFTCVEAQLSALQQAELDPLQEDMVGKRTNHERCDEYLRVFHLKQIRKYAAVNGLNPDGHRDEIDIKEDFLRHYFNATIFEEYLKEKGFRVSPEQMRELIRYEIDVVGVLSA